MLPTFEMSITIILTAITIVVGVFYWISVSTYDYWKKKGILYEPPTPLFGNIKDALLMRRNYCHVHDDLYKKYKGHRFVGIYHARKPALMVMDPDLIKHILVKDFTNFQDRDMGSDKLNPLNQNLFTLTGHRWKVLRNKLSPTFTSGRMKNMFPLLEESSEKLVEYLKDSADKNEVIEMKDVLAKFSTDIIGSCAFGLQMQALEDPNSEFRKVGRKIFESSNSTTFIRNMRMIAPKIGKFLMHHSSQKKMSEFFINLVKETVDHRIVNKVTRNDFMQLLINLRFKGSIDSEYNVKEINGSSRHANDTIDFELDDGLMAAQAFVFFAAGFETSSTTMSFTLLELAMNQDIQNRLQEEVDFHIEQNGGKLTYDSVMNMKYLDQVVSETLRLYAPVMYLRREVTEPFTIPDTNLTLEQGTAVYVPVFSLHRDPKYYPDPLTFNPERFTEEEKARRNKYVYLPFGEGPRNCIGMRFGLMQTKMGLATLVSKYEFHICEQTDVPIKLDPISVVLASTTGTIVRIRNRN